MKNKGYRWSWEVIFWRLHFLGGRKGVPPPPKNSIFKRYYVSEQIDRKSQHETFQYIYLLGVSKRREVTQGPKDPPLQQQG